MTPDTLNRLLEAGIIVLEDRDYVFYSGREQIRTVLGNNTYIVRYVIPYYSELYTRFYQHNQERG